MVILVSCIVLGGVGDDAEDKATDAEVLTETRAGIPVGDQRRFDVYKDVST